jgi:hypothetical protein
VALTVAVLMPNVSLALRRRRVGAFDPHGEPVPAGYEVPSQALPGMVREEADGSWLLLLDPALWPVRLNDLVVGGGAQWLVTGSHMASNSMDPEADYVRCTGAQQTIGTEPPGREFVGR